MAGRQLADKLNYTGMVRGVRKLAVENKLAPVEKIAIMSEIEVCDLILNHYEMVYADGDSVGLVRKEDAEALYKLLKIISR